MSRLLLILAIILYAVPSFSQQEEVKSGTIRVVKKKYKERRIYPMGMGNAFLGSDWAGNSLLVANLDGQNGYYAMKGEELVLQGRLFVNSDEYKIVSFDMSCIISGLEVVESSVSKEFSENQIRLVRYMRKGMRLYLGNIKCKNADGDVKFLGRITVTILSGITSGGPARDPFMIASIAGVYGIGSLRISKKVLMKALKIDLADPSSKILGFSLAYGQNRIKELEHSTSDQFTPKMKEILSKMKTGDEVELRRIRYSTDGGPSITSGDMFFALVK